MLIVKRWLADNEILQIIALVPEATAHAMRVGMDRPTGVAPRRLITQKVQGRIRREASACLKNGDISQAAHEYLTNWASGNLQRKTKPAMYSYLMNSWRGDGHIHMNPAHRFVTPHRMKIFDLWPGDSDSEHSSAGDNPDPITGDTED